MANNNSKPPFALVPGQSKLNPAQQQQLIQSFGNSNNNKATGGLVYWKDIKGTPPTLIPASHTHQESDIIGLVKDLKDLKNRKLDSAFVLTSVDYTYPASSVIAQGVNVNFTTGTDTPETGGVEYGTLLINSYPTIVDTVPTVDDVDNPTDIKDNSLYALIVSHGSDFSYDLYSLYNPGPTVDMDGHPVDAITPTWHLVSVGYNDVRFTDSRIPKGPAGGDLDGTYPNPTIKAIGAGGTAGNTTQWPIITYNTKGQVTGFTLQTAPVYTLPVIGSGGTAGDSTHWPVITYDTNGRITGFTTVLAPTYTLPTIGSSGTAGDSTHWPLISVDVNGRVTSYSDQLAPVQKRMLMARFEAPPVADTTPNTSKAFQLPRSTSGATTNWIPVSAVIHTDAPNASATTCQIYYGASFTSTFGSGTAMLTSALSISGTSTYGQEYTSSGFTSGLTLATGVMIAPKFSALGTAQVWVTIQFQEV